MDVEAAARLRRPSWRDARLLVGVALVLASVATGARVVALADRTVPVFAARRTLASGAPLTKDVVTVVHVRLTGTQARYLSARAELPQGRILLRVIGQGEIVPLSALGSVSEMARRPVTVPLDAPPAPGLVVGGSADVWASARRRETAAGGVAGSYASPRPIATSVEIASVARAGSALSSARGSSVQVLLDETELPALLDALANGARVAVVPVPGSDPDLAP